ncbi:HD domain-containing protein [Mucilaginibacter sp.]|uniref:HD domain-containing protein n=1 Tax=Mucilaginibacter sp. TaxID=1882438 RepID=UPI0025E9EF9E|nr:HD domain-containing protein [Mucilaginibacter sp.]
MTNFIDIDVAEKFATDLIQHLPPSLTFHNWQHTAEVVETAMEIADYCCLDQEPTLLLKLAALFHDTCYRDS